MRLLIISLIVCLVTSSFADDLVVPAGSIVTVEFPEKAKEKKVVKTDTTYFFMARKTLEAVYAKAEAVPELKQKILDCQNDNAILSKKQEDGDFFRIMKIAGVGIAIASSFFLGMMISR